MQSSSGTESRGSHTKLNISSVFQGARQRLPKDSSEMNLSRASHYDLIGEQEEEEMDQVERISKRQIYLGAELYSPNTII